MPQNLENKSKVQVEIKNITKTYPGAVAVKDVSFNLAPGEVMGLLGPNGAGKSSTMKMIAGLLMADQGEILINGKSWEPWDRGRPKVGLLLEDPPLYPELTVQTYLQMVAGINEMGAKEGQSAIDMVVERLRLQPVFKKMIHSLSKGYRQRLGLAQAMLPSPSILLLDEPTNGLDPVSMKEMREIILGLRGDHTLLISSHHLHEIELMCEAITILHHGQLLFSGSIKEARKSFGQIKKIKMVVKNFNNECLTKIPSQIKILTTAYNSNQNESELIFQSQGGLDAREVLWDFAQNEKLKVLELTPLELPLEEVFMLATQNDRILEGEIAP